ncbi:MAG: DUF3995 domain-containing protein [Flavobacteriaceae bacterium]
MNHIILSVLSTILFFIFLLLSFIHFYWALGGKWAMKNAIPTKIENENSEFRPSSLATFLVGLFLIVIALFYMIQSGFTLLKPPSWTSRFLFILPSIFLLRAIGEFNYVGLFKRIKSTGFAKWDSKLYTPLCLIISSLGFGIYYLS